MTIDTTQSGSVYVVRVSGRMDAENALAFDQACDACVQDGARKVVVDLSGLEYISSMGLRSFVALGQKLKEKGGSLSLCCLTGFVRQVFQITRLNTVFPIHDTVEGALAEA